MTPEMEFIAAREGLHVDLVRTRWPSAGDDPGQRSNTRVPSR